MGSPCAGGESSYPATSDGRAMEAVDRKQLLKRLGDFLRLVGQDPKDVDVYILALELGSVSTTALDEHLPKLGGKTKDRLDRLARNGFFERSPGPAKKNQPIVYIPVPPTIALRERFAAASAVVRDMELLDELLEVGQDARDEEAFLLVDDQASAMGLLAQAITAASSQVQAYCRDGTWWDDSAVQDAIRKAVERGVRVRVAATALTTDHANSMADAKVETVRATTPMNPFFIIDGVSLLIPHRGASIAYRGLRVTNRYIIQNLASFHEHCFVNGGAP